MCRCFWLSRIIVSWLIMARRTSSATGLAVRPGLPNSDGLAKYVPLLLRLLKTSFFFNLSIILTKIGKLHQGPQEDLGCLRPNRRTGPNLWGSYLPGYREGRPFGAHGPGKQYLNSIAWALLTWSPQKNYSLPTRWPCWGASWQVLLMPLRQRITKSMAPFIRDSLTLLCLSRVFVKRKHESFYLF